MKRISKGHFRAFADTIRRSIGTRGRSNMIDATWVMMGNMSYAALQWLMVILIAKYGGVSELGHYSIALAIVAPIFLLGNMNLYAVQSGDSNGDFEIGDFLALRAAAIVASVAAVTAVVWTMSRFSEMPRLVVMVVVLVKVVESLGDVLYGFYTKELHLHRLGVSKSLRSLVALPLFFVALQASGKLETALLALVAAYLLVVICYDIPAVYQVYALRKTALPSVGEWSVSSGTIRRLALLSFPLGIIAAIEAVSFNIPRYVLHFAEGPEAVGIYSAIGTLLISGGIIVDSIGHSAMPKMSRAYRNDRADFTAWITRITAAGALLSFLGIVGAVTFGEELLRILYTPEIAEYAHALIALAVISVAAYAGSSWGHALKSVRVFKAQLPAFWVGGLATIFATAILVPNYGIFGAISGLGVGFLAKAIAQAVLLRRVVGNKMGQSEFSSTTEAIIDISSG